MGKKVEVQKPAIAAIARQAAIAAGIAIVVNAVLFFIGSALGAFPDNVLVPQTGAPVSITDILMMSVLSTVAAIIGYFVLSRFLSRQRARQIFIILAVLVLLGMATTPFSIPNVPMLQIVLLEVMHVVLGGALVYYLVRA